MPNIVAQRSLRERGTGRNATCDLNESIELILRADVNKEHHDTLASERRLDRVDISIS